MTLDNAALRTRAKQKIPSISSDDTPLNLATLVISGKHAKRIADRDGLFWMWSNPVGRFVGWICDPSLTQNQHVEITQDYFKALKLEFFFDDQGNYLGPDDCGIEPMFRAP